MSFYLPNGYIYKGDTSGKFNVACGVGDTITMTIDMTEEGILCIYRNGNKLGTPFIGISALKDPKFMFSLYNNGDVI